MQMENPPHPGKIIKERFLDPLRLTVTEAARGLGISRKHLSQVLSGHYGISPEMAMRLELAFGTSAEFWLNAQTAYDLWVVGQRAGEFNVKRLAA